MLAISRFRYGAAELATAEAELADCLSAFHECAGFQGGVVGRALDDQGLWVLQTSWDSVGAYRRALSSYRIKVATATLMMRVLDEPSAYEVLVGDGATKPNEEKPRGAVP